MKQLIICILILIAAVSCELKSSLNSSDKQKPDELTNHQNETSGDKITVFLTGNTLGSLKPCGCSGGQLGGLDRRPAIFDTVPADTRLLIDTGFLVKDQSVKDQSVREQSAQDLNKFITIAQSLKYLKYDVVNLTKLDLEMGRETGMLDSSSKEFITAYETDEKFHVGIQQKFELNGQIINIAVVSFDPLEMPVDLIKQLFPDEPGEKKVNILILNNYSDEIISSISQLGIVDCLVCPIKSDEPTVVSAPGAKPFVFAVGQYGRHISKLTIQPDADNNFKFNLDDIPVKQEIAQDDYLVNLYKDYQLRIKDANLLENNSRYGLPDGLKYVGSASCQAVGCHQYEWVTWKANKHSSAYATLEQAGSQYDPECVVCHVVGYDFETGFVSASKTPLLENVGCEYCHGPGSEHNKNPYKNKLTVRHTVQEVITEVCLKCHVPEHSGDFAGHEREKLQIINHWTELKDANNVK